MRWGERRGGGEEEALRDQVLLALLAVDVLGLGAGDADVCGVGALLQQVVERVQVVRLRSGGSRGGGGRRGSGGGERGEVFIICYYTLNCQLERVSFTGT